MPQKNKLMIPDNPPPSHSIASPKEKDPNAVKNKTVISYFGYLYNDEYFIKPQHIKPHTTPINIEPNDTPKN